MNKNNNIALSHCKMKTFSGSLLFALLLNILTTTSVNSYGIGKLELKVFYCMTFKIHSRLLMCNIIGIDFAKSLLMVEHFRLPLHFEVVFFLSKTSLEITFTGLNELIGLPIDEFENYRTFQYFESLRSLFICTL